MIHSQFYALLGAGLFSMGLYALIVHAHLLRKILAINIMGSGVFLVLVALAKRSVHAAADVVPHAMVITGIVVAVSATALALTLALTLALSMARAQVLKPTAAEENTGPNGNRKA